MLLLLEVALAIYVYVDRNRVSWLHFKLNNIKVALSVKQVRWHVNRKKRLKSHNNYFDQMFYFVPKSFKWAAYKSQILSKQTVFEEKGNLLVN